MKHPFWGLLVLCIFSLSAWSQERIYRCGHEYTNTVPDAKAQGCKLMEGGQITVVQGTRAQALAAAPARLPPASDSSARQRVDPSEQKARDADARKILEAELKKTEMRQLDLLQAYKQGLPEKREDEASKPQKYQDRVADLKARVARGEADLSGIRRELARLGSPAAPVQAKP
jgi:hypothetical protein